MTSDDDNGHDDGPSEASGAAESGQKRRRRRRHRREQADGPRNEERMSDQPSRSAQRPQRANARDSRDVAPLSTVPRTLVATPVAEPRRARGGRRSATGGSATTDNDAIGDGSEARVVTNLRGTVLSGRNRNTRGDAHPRRGRPLDRNDASSQLDPRRANPQHSRPLDPDDESSDSDPLLDNPRRGPLDPDDASSQLDSRRANPQHSRPLDPDDESSDSDPLLDNPRRGPLDPDDDSFDSDPRDATRGGESPLSIAAEFPPDPPATDPDPVSFELVDGSRASLDEDLTSVVGVRFVPAGRITWCNAGDQYFAPKERVVVDSDRGPRLAWVVTAPARKPVVDRGMRRVLRRATEHDLSSERTDDAQQTRALRIAKDAGAALRLPLKVFRVEVSGGKLIVYYTTEERLDVRDFARNVSQAVNMRIELRQIGGRDEAKLVGGIGSCGLPLCCTTWLPEFVPVSIKMAKDQGLVLSPSRVSGQCGRLKCCLVYEQEAYAELRKGLPKLGKRVVSARGEGRVVEVDVLTQRVRVSYAPGDTELLPASEVTPKFPSGTPSGRADHAAGSEAALRGDSDDTARDDERPNDDISDEDPSDSP